MNPAAQLIAEIAINGMDSFQTDLGKTGTIVDGIFATIEAGMSGMVDAVETGISGIVAALVAGAAAFGVFAAAAIREATKVQKFSLEFGGLFGDMAKGEQETAYIRQRAKELLTTSDDAVQAGVRFASAGLNFGHFARQWYILSQMAGGGAGMQNMFTDMYVRFASGTINSQGFRALRKAGIGADDFRAEGIKIGAGNRVDPNTTADQMFKALDNITVKHHFDKVAKALEDSMAVSFVNIQDSWNILLENFGKAFFPLIKTLIDAVAPFINFLADSGEITRVGKAFSDAFASVFGAAGGTNAVVVFLTYFMTTMEMLPGVIKNVGTVLVNAAHAIFSFVDKVFVNLVNAMNEWFVGLHNNFNAINNMFTTFFRTWWEFGVKITQLFGMNKGMSSDFQTVGARVAREFPDIVQHRFQPGDMGGALANVLNQLGGGALNGVGNQFHNRQQQMLQEYMDYQKRPNANVENPQGNGVWDSGHVPAIEKNTKDTANATAHVAASMEHFKRYALGGGDRGKTGIAVSEFYARGGGAPIQVDVRTGNQHLDRYMSHAVGQAIQGMRRAGALGGG